MKREIAITSVTKELFNQSEEPSSNEAIKVSLLKIWSAVKSIFFSLIGFAVLGGIWHLISILKDGGLPTPYATLTVFWELVRDPFYDYGPNDKGIGLQLASSLVRVFSGFVLGSLFAIPVGFLMGASAIGKKIFYPI